jgi:hypothetical protein
MNNGGREALLHHLLNFDLSKINLRAIPKTAALLEQKISSLTPEAGCLFDLLARGELPWGCEWYRECPSKRLIDDYIAHASKRGRGRRSIEVSIGIFLTKHVPGITRVDGVFNVWTGRPQEGEDGEMKLVRGYVYQFPPLAECRKNFAALIGHDLPWSARSGRKHRNPESVIPPSRSSAISP